MNVCRNLRTGIGLTQWYRVIPLSWLKSKLVEFRADIEAQEREAKGLLEGILAVGELA